ncbi:MAG: putative lipid II flippase FtsW [Clostridia bacterium]|nr:putative lipid II flippase FtsW [Clostridia bacterium]
MKVKFDYILFFAVLMLVLLGLLFVYSASMYSAETTYGNKFFFLSKQLVGALVGLVVMVGISFVKLDVIKKFWIVGVAISIILLALVFVPGIGVENYGARRWIGFGSFTIQPSEIAKFAYVLFCAVYMSKKDMSKLKNCIWPVVVGGAFCLLIIAEPNMSITMCVAMLMVIMLFIGGMKGKYFLMLLVPLALAVPLLIIAEPYRLQRLLAFVDPWASPKGEGYQLIQSLYALGGGGWFGVGLFNSRQKYRFLPFAESDFILSVIGEEVGLVGCLFVFALYLVVILRGVRIAINCKDKFSCFLASGICSVIAIQSLLNFAVVTGSIPPTGLPLPFISYGGTSLVVFMGAVGILLNISKQVLQDVGVKSWIT